MAITSIRVAGINTKAIEQAAMLDDTFFDHADTVVAADLIKKTTGATVYQDLLRCFGTPHKKGNTTVYTVSELMAAWPRIDTGNPDRDQPLGEGNPDWTKAMNGKRQVWVSYFDTMVTRAPRAMAIVAEMENLSDLIKAKPAIGERLDLEAKVDTLANKLQQYKATFRKGVKLLQTMEAAAEHYPELKIDFRLDADGDVIQGVAPVMAYPQERPLLGQNFTVAQLCSVSTVNPKFAPLTGWEVVSTSGETDPEKRWDIFLSTMTRETQEDEDDADNIEITNAKQFETAAASMLHLMEQGSFTTSLFSKIDKAKDISAHADFIKTLVDLAVEFNSLANDLKKPRKGGKGSLYEQAMAADEEVVAEATTLTMDDADIPDYRSRFPLETKGLTDEQMFNVIAATTDDQEDAEWRALFAAVKGRKVA